MADNSHNSSTRYPVIGGGRLPLAHPNAPLRNLARHDQPPPTPPPPPDLSGYCQVFINSCDDNSSINTVTANLDNIGICEAQMTAFGPAHANLEWTANSDGAITRESHTDCMGDNIAAHGADLGGAAWGWVMATDTTIGLRYAQALLTFNINPDPGPASFAVVWSNFAQDATGQWSADWVLTWINDNGDGTFTSYVWSGTLDHTMQYPAPAGIVETIPIAQPG